MNSFSTNKLNEALRGERAAVETYRQALDKISADPRAQELRDIHNDHVAAVSELSRNITLRKDHADTSSGVWGSFAKAVMGTAKLFGDKAALKALKEGEEHGLKQYHDIATDEEIDVAMKSFVTDRLIPQQQAHIRRLDTMMSQVF